MNDRNKKKIKTWLIILSKSTCSVCKEGSILKGNLIVGMKKVGTRNCKYIVSINHSFFSNSLCSKGELDMYFLKGLYKDYEKNLKARNIRQFPRIMFYQIGMYLLSSCYRTKSFFYRIGLNSKRKKRFDSLFLWLLRKCEENGKFSN